jgi:apolipoprotein N-acyltransferase
MYLYLITGLLLFLSEPPVGLWPLAFVALIPLVHAAHKSKSYRYAALGGFLAGIAFFLPGLFWLTSVTYIGWVALALYCALYVAAYAVLARSATNVLALAAGWTFLEFVRGAVAFTGFPWLLLSHSQYPFTLFTQILDVTGAYGLSGLMAALNILIWTGFTTPKRRNFVIAAGLFAAITLYGAIRIQTITLKRAQHVGLVQASVPQEMKQALEEDTYDPVGVLKRYLDATIKLPRNPKVDLIVWPETVVLSPYTLNVDPRILRESTSAEAQFAQESLAKLAQLNDAYFLAGSTSFLPAEYGYVSDPQVASKIPEGNWRRQYNSAYLLDPAGRYVDRYDKIHLVPFGEYIPLRNIFPFLAEFVPFDASLSPGQRQTIFHVKDGATMLSFGVLICYEDSDSELARRLRRDGAAFLVNVSNDAWFGLSELDQHFVTARFRAVENRVGVIRSGNNGLSGLIDPLGRAEILLDKNAIGSAAGDLWVTDSKSVYTAVGDLPEVAVSGVILIWEFARRKKLPARISRIQSV